MASIGRFGKSSHKKKLGRRAATKTNGFASKLENDVHEMLLKRESSGELSNIRCQHRVDLIYGEERTSRLEWKIDFSAIKASTGERVFFEAKGFEEDVYKIKLKLFRVIGEGVLEIWKRGKNNSLVLDEIVEPIILNTTQAEQDAIRNQFGIGGLWEDRRLKMLEAKKEKRRMYAKKVREDRKSTREKGNEKR